MSRGHVSFDDNELLWPHNILRQSFDDEFSRIAQDKRGTRCFYISGLTAKKTSVAARGYGVN